MGFAAGVLLAVQGGIAMPAFWGALSSAIFISGPLQYLFVDWVRLSLSLGSVLLVVLCINLRYCLYGLSLLETFKGAGFWTRLYLIAGITDETYALETACTLPPKAKRAYCLILTALDHLYWVLGVTAGALAGSALPIPSKGIDFAMTALFLVILTDQCRNKANRTPAAIGGMSAVAVFATLWILFNSATAKSEMLIPSIVAILAILISARKRIEKNLESANEL
jgi:4-azaleucine resistance transporter AzlC